MYLYIWRISSQLWQFNIAVAQRSAEGREHSSGCAAGSWDNLVTTCCGSLVMKSLVLDKHGTSAFHPF